MSGVLDWIVVLMRTIGAPGVGVATALETVFPPVPSEVVLPLAGFTASQGHYGVVAAVLWATVGSVAGALVLYYVGMAWGLTRVLATADRLPLVGVDDVQRSIDWFGRHGRSAVLLGRLVPGVRSLVSIPAGIDRMPLPVFIGFTTLGSLAWNTLLIVSGYLLGSQWFRVEAYVGDISHVIYVLVAVALVVFVARRLRHRVRGRPSPRPDAE